MTSTHPIDPLNPAAYLIAKPGADLRLSSDKAFSYILGANGLFKVAHAPAFSACIPIGQWSRPLPGLRIIDASKIKMTRGRISSSLLDAALAAARRASWARPMEIMFQIAINGRHVYLRRPPQDATAGSIEYRAPEGTEIVVDLHSHHTMSTDFSATDNRDEQGLKVYGVMGRIFKQPALRLRVGIYGDFHPIPATAVFYGPINLVDMYHEEVMK